MWENYYLDKSLLSKIQYPIVTCSVKPSVSILSTDEAKNYLKVNNNSTDDSLIGILIKSSVNTIENVINKVIHKSTFVQKQSGGVDKIILIKSPVNEITSLTYYESFDSEGEELEENSDFRRVGNILYHANNYFISGRDGDGYSIEYDAGLFDSATDDNSTEYTVIKTVMMRLVSYLYENRQQYCTNFNEENWSISYNTNDIPFELKTMLFPLREPNLGVL